MLLNGAAHATNAGPANQLHACHPTTDVRLVYAADLADVPHVDVVVCRSYVPSEAEKADPRLYANNVRELISIIGQLPMYDLEWAEKLQFEPANKREKSIAQFRKAKEAQAASGAKNASTGPTRRRVKAKK